MCCGSLSAMEATEGIEAMEGVLDGTEGTEEESRVEVEITYDTSVAPHKADEPYLYVMYDAAKPESGKLYFTQAEWDACPTQCAKFGTCAMTVYRDGALVWGAPP